MQAAQKQILNSNLFSLFSYYYSKPQGWSESENRIVCSIFSEGNKLVFRWSKSDNHTVCSIFSEGSTLIPIQGVYATLEVHCSWISTKLKAQRCSPFTVALKTYHKYRNPLHGLLRSLPPSPEVPGSIPGLVEGWIFGWPSFPLKFTQLSILPGSVKWVPAYMDWFEAAATCAYICFRSAGINWSL